MSVYELNIDGLVGPTHHYAGLSLGNRASTDHALTPSNPQAAARQGLAKMRLLHSLGLKQGIVPPHQRPNLQLLYDLGFTGNPTAQINKAFQQAPELLSACYSASSMWAANTATVSASTDTDDGLVHLTPANLITYLHRAQEADFAATLLRTLFANPRYFHHHDTAPKTGTTSDEGAANHSRFCHRHADRGVYLFVYGRSGLNHEDPHKPKIYPARQTLEACKLIARSHQLHPEHVIFARQNPKAIDAGVFHNDVISVANEWVFLVHEQAFYQQKILLKQLQDKAPFLTMIEISESALSLEDAVNTYFFNSQLVTLPEQDHMVLIAPIECQHHPKAALCVNRLLEDKSNPIDAVHYLDLKQSMQNGGGPACLRLRMVLNTQELAAMHQGVLMDNTLFHRIDQWILKHYRTELLPADLADPDLMHEALYALDELTQILKLGSIYPFQVG